MTGFSLSLPRSDTSVPLLFRGRVGVGRSGWGVLGGGGARRAQAPEDDLGLVDCVAVGVGGRQARDLADGTVDVGDGAARAAHQVVVVVADPYLVAGHRAAGLDAPGETGCGERSQRVVDRLVGHLRQVTAYDADHRLRVGVSQLEQGIENGEPRAGHPQPGVPQQLREVRRRGHRSILACFLERVKIRGGSSAYPPPTTSATARSRARVTSETVAKPARSAFEPGRTGSAELTDTQVRRPPSTAFDSATAWPVVPLP